MKYEGTLWFVRVALAGLLGVEAAGLLGAFSGIDDRVWPGLLFMSAVSWGFLEVLDWWMRTHNLARPPALVVLVGLAVVCMDAIGNIAGWYSSIQRYDVLVHAASGLAVTAVLFYAVRNVMQIFKIRMGVWAGGYIAWTTMAAAAMVFEIGEWAADLMFGISFWLGSGQDTVTDLLAAMAGGAGALAVIWLAGALPSKKRDLRHG